MDNEVSEDLKKYSEDSDIQFQLVPSNMHRRNAAERAVRTFKNNFIAVLCTVDPRFPFYLWDRLLPQVTMTLNMLRQSRLKPGLSAYEQVDGIHKFENNTISTIGVQGTNSLNNLISDSPTLPTQLMNGTLDQQSIIIDATPAITVILEGKLKQIQ